MHPWQPGQVKAYKLKQMMIIVIRFLSNMKSTSTFSSKLHRANQFVR
ncbi:hypothetical protein NC653_033536 [Populus alba x Populus x berolinensis]|uniref:Uncharacterized protein n=1 Tax=Populus alba x Populus x berolinensis TaxID=444605 RepID=A0AAD6LTW0_9ROSI|nr:hypothetical protein NC653_033536 [Populus alba x Populus x berolinensis]